METDIEKYNTISLISFDSLYQRFRNEVLAELKYSDPEIDARKVDLLAGWKFSEYVKTN